MGSFLTTEVPAWQQPPWSDGPAPTQIRSLPLPQRNAIEIQAAMVITLEPTDGQWERIYARRLNRVFTYMPTAWDLRMNVLHDDPDLVYIALDQMDISGWDPDDLPWLRPHMTISDGTHFADFADLHGWKATARALLRGSEGTGIKINFLPAASRGTYRLSPTCELFGFALRLRESLPNAQTRDLHISVVRA